MPNQNSKDQTQQLDVSALLDHAVREEAKRRSEHMQVRETSNRKSNKLVLAVCAAVVALAVGGTCIGIGMQRKKSAQSEETKKPKPVFTSPSDASADSDSTALSGSSTANADGGGVFSDAASDASQTSETTAVPEDAEVIRSDEGYFIYLKNGGLWYRDVTKEAPICLTENFIHQVDPSNPIYYDMMDSCETKELLLGSWIYVMPDKSGVFFPMTVHPALQSTLAHFGPDYDNSFSTTIVYRSLTEDDETLRVMDTDIWEYMILPDQSGALYRKLIRNGANDYHFNLYWTDFETTNLLSDDCNRFMLSKNGKRLIIVGTDKNTTEWRARMQIRSLTASGTLAPEVVYEGTYDYNAYYNDDFSKITFQDDPNDGIQCWTEGEGVKTVVDVPLASIINYCSDGTFYWVSRTDASYQKGERTLSSHMPSNYESLSEIHPDVSDDLDLQCEVINGLDYLEDEKAAQDEGKLTKDPDWENIRIRNKIRRELGDRYGSAGMARENCLFYFDGTKNILLSETVEHMSYSAMDDGIYFTEQVRSFPKFSMAELEALVKDQHYGAIGQKLEEYLAFSYEERLEDCVRLVLATRGTRTVIGDPSPFDPERVNCIIFNRVGTDAEPGLGSDDTFSIVELASKTVRLSFDAVTTEFDTKARMKQFRDFGKTLVKEREVDFHSIYINQGDSYYMTQKDTQTKTVWREDEALFDCYQPENTAQNTNFVKRLWADEMFCYLTDGAVVRSETSSSLAVHSGTLCIYTEDGGSRTIAPNVYKYSVNPEGMLYYLSDYQGNYDSGSLSWLKNDQTPVRIDENVEAVLNVEYLNLSYRYGLPTYGISSNS